MSVCSSHGRGAEWTGWAVQRPLSQPVGLCPEDGDLLRGCAKLRLDSSIFQGPLGDEMSPQTTCSGLKMCARPTDPAYLDAANACLMTEGPLRARYTLSTSSGIPTAVQWAGPHHAQTWKSSRRDKSPQWHSSVSKD